MGLESIIIRQILEIIVNLSEIRRRNACVIMQENALDELSFAMCLGKDEEQMNGLLMDASKKKINDGLARLMEQTFSKPKLWLDQGATDEAGQQGPSYDLFG